MKRPAGVRTVKRLEVRRLRVISLYTASFSDADFAACLQSLTKEFSKGPTFRCQVQLTIERLDLLGPFFQGWSSGAMQRADVLASIARGHFDALVCWVPPYLGKQHQQLCTFISDAIAAAVHGHLWVFALLS